MRHPVRRRMAVFSCAGRCFRSAAAGTPAQQASGCAPTASRCFRRPAGSEPGTLTGPHPANRPLREGHVDSRELGRWSTAHLAPPADKLASTPLRGPGSNPSGAATPHQPPPPSVGRFCADAVIPGACLENACTLTCVTRGCGFFSHVTGPGSTAVEVRGVVLGGPRPLASSTCCTSYNRHGRSAAPRTCRIGIRRERHGWHLGRLVSGADCAWGDRW